jgi:hypothetical protein
VRLAWLTLIWFCACELTQAQRQRDWAKAMTPPALGAVTTVPHQANLRLRIAVDPQYISQNPGWEARVRAIVDRANALSESRFGAHFEIVAIGPWQHNASSALEPLLDQLVADVPAEGEDLVVGFTSSLPLFTATFEDLGVARIFGRHAVLRGIDQHAQADVIMRDLTRLDDSEKLAVVRARVEHQETSVFLHEWGHCSGAMHDRDVSFIMSPQYKDSHREFSPQSQRSIELALQHRADRHAWLEAARVHLTSLTVSSLAPGVPEQIARIFDRGDAGTAAVEVRPLSEVDRELFNRAVQKQNERRKEDALAMLLPLMQRYPRHPLVQTFACSLFAAVKPADVETRTVCRTAMDVDALDPRPAMSLAWAHLQTKENASMREATLEARRRAALRKREAAVQTELAELLGRGGFLTWAEEELALAELYVPAQEVQGTLTRQRRTFGLATGALAPGDESAYVEGWLAIADDLHSRRNVRGRERGIAFARTYPRVAGAWTLSCEAQLALGFSGDARPACGKALALDPSATRAHYLLGLMDENERQRASAVAHFEKCLDDGNADVFGRLARLYSALKMDSALATLRQKYQQQFGKPLP